MVGHSLSVGTLSLGFPIEMYNKFVVKNWILLNDKLKLVGNDIISYYFKLWSSSLYMN